MAATRSFATIALRLPSQPGESSVCDQIPRNWQFNAPCAPIWLDGPPAGPRLLLADRSRHVAGDRPSLGSPPGARPRSSRTLPCLPRLPPGEPSGRSGTSAVPGSTVLTASSRQISASRPRPRSIPISGANGGLPRSRPRRLAENPRLAERHRRGHGLLGTPGRSSRLGRQHVDTPCQRANDRNRRQSRRRLRRQRRHPGRYDLAWARPWPASSVPLAAMALAAQGISGVAAHGGNYSPPRSTTGSIDRAIDTTIEAMLRIVQLKTEYFQPFEVVVSANSGLRSESAVEREAIRTLGSVGILYVTNAGDANGDPNSGAAGLDLDGVNSRSRRTTARSLIMCARSPPRHRPMQSGSNRGAATSVSCRSLHQATRSSPRRCPAAPSAPAPARPWPQRASVAGAAALLKSHRSRRPHARRRGGDSRRGRRLRGSRRRCDAKVGG